jgi:hypothetical protein
LLLIAAVVAALVAPRGDGDAAPRRLVRADPATGPFEGLGTWVDIYDEEAWADPSASVQDMAVHGVRTLYLQTSNADRPGSFVFPSGVAAFVDRAHDVGLEVVAWYLPNLTDPALDRARVRDALSFATPRGDRFDGFALDIESAAVRNATRRSARLIHLSSQIRADAGDGFPLGAVIPSPLRLHEDLAYWPAFPWRELAVTYDAILPMTYFTFRARGPSASFDYVAGSVDEIRARVGSDQVPINVIGGLARDASDRETAAFVLAVRDRGVLGAGWYTWPDTTPGQWAALRGVG